MFESLRSLISFAENSIVLPAPCGPTSSEIMKYALISSSFISCCKLDGKFCITACLYRWIWSYTSVYFTFACLLEHFSLTQQ